MELILNKEIKYTTDFGNIYGKIFYNGPIILFLHGWLHSSEIWSKLFKIIPKRFKLIALDLPGFGKSNPINHSKITIQTYSMILQQIVDKIKKTEKLYAVFGDSISGLLILNLLTRGEFNNTKILISGCPIDGLPSYLNIFRTNGLVKHTLRLLKKAWFFKDIIIKYFSFLTVNNFKVIDRPFINSVLSADPHTSEKLLLEMFQPSDIDLCKITINAPIVISRGQNDRIVSSSSSKKLAQKLNAVYQEIPNSGHTPMIENVIYYNKLIKSLL